MKRAPSVNEVPELFQWVRDVCSVSDCIQAHGWFVSDGRLMGVNGRLLEVSEESLRKYLNYLSRFGDNFVLEDEILFRLNCSAKFKAKLKHRKIPAEFSIKLLF